MNEDPRCCGRGTCIIDVEGRCWCGQLWDGQKMCHAPLAQAEAQGQENVVGSLRPTTERQS